MNNSGRFDGTALRFFDKMLAAGPYLIVTIMFLVTIASITSLLGVDIFTGKITSEHMWKDSQVAWFTSLGTTGLLTASIAILIHLFKIKTKWPVIIAFAIVVIAMTGTDIYFDSISVDIKRFGEIVVADTLLSPPEAFAHKLFRVLIGTLSFVGEPMAASAIVIFPILREFLNNLVNDSTKMRSHLGAYNPSPGQKQPQRNYPKPTNYYPSPRPIPRPTPFSQEEPSYHSITNRNTNSAQASFLDKNED